MDNFYKIGEKYWASNPKAGRNIQSPGTLAGWDEYNNAILFNDRWGYWHVSIENLDSHNKD